MRYIFLFLALICFSSTVIHATSARDSLRINSFIPNRQLHKLTPTIMILEGSFYLNHPSYKTQILTDKYSQESTKQSDIFQEIINSWEQKNSKFYQIENILRWQNIEQSIESSNFSYIRLDEWIQKTINMPDSFFTKFIFKLLKDFKEDQDEFKFEKHYSFAKEISPHMKNSLWNRDKAPEQIDLFYALKAVELFKIAENILNNVPANQHLKAEFKSSTEHIFATLLNKIESQSRSDYIKILILELYGYVLSSYNQEISINEFLENWKIRLSLSINMEWKKIKILSSSFEQLSHSSFILGLLFDQKKGLLPKGNFIPIDIPEQGLLSGFKRIRNLLRLSDYQVDALSLSTWTHSTNQDIVAIVDLIKNILIENPHLIIFKSAGNEDSKFSDDNIYHQHFRSIIDQFPGRFILVGNYDQKQKLIKGMKAGLLASGYFLANGSHFVSTSPLEAISYTSLTRSSGTSLAAPVMMANYFISKNYLFHLVGQSHTITETWKIITKLAQENRQLMCLNPLFCGQGYYEPLLLKKLN